MIKTFKTIDEQIEILKSKGLKIDDVDYAKDILLRENYFFLSGYRHLFLKSKKRVWGTQHDLLNSPTRLYNGDLRISSITNHLYLYANSSDIPWQNRLLLRQGIVVTLLRYGITTYHRVVVDGHILPLRSVGG